MTISNLFSVIYILSLIFFRKKIIIVPSNIIEKYVNTLYMPSGIGSLNSTGPEKIPIAITIR